MALDLEQIKKYHDKAYLSGQVTRERAADDLVFYWVTHWDDNSLNESQLAYRGEFDILRKAGRGILSDLASNPIQVDFEPKDEDREDAAEILDGLYRMDNQNNTSIEAFNNADQENIVCGFGAWILYTTYQDVRGGETNQVIRRRPIYEANNSVFWDPNAKLMDKSDAKYVSVLFAYSEDGYKELVRDLTGEELDKIDYSQFKSPEISQAFPWIAGKGKKIYVAEFYHRAKVREKVLTLENPFGQSITLKESDLDEVMDDMLDSGFEIISEKEIDRWQVTKYICSGKDILESTVIPGEHIPVVPVYGERAFIEGEEHYEGITRLAKDPQRLRDFQMSYLADIASRSPREKPVFMQEQVAGHEDMYSESGADNNYPYVLQNRLAPDGTPLPIGPIGMLPAPEIPPALAAVLDLTRQAVEDVANPGIPQDIADPDLSGKAVLALQARLDMQSMVYQEHKKHAQRRDGEIYASMASEIYDVPRPVKIAKPDGSRETVMMMETVIDAETGELVTLRDIYNQAFDVYSEISSSYKSQKDQTIDRLERMIQGIPPGDPMRNVLMLKLLRLMDGVDFDDVRDYASKQLLLMGIREPENDEEKELIAQQQQQGDEPSAEMLLAQAEMMKGEADKMRELRENIKLQLEYRNKDMKARIDTFNAQTKRMDTQIDAQEAGAKINKTNIEAFGEQIENQAKVIKLRQPQEMSDEDLVKELLGG